MGVISPLYYDYVTANHWRPVTKFMYYLYTLIHMTHCWFTLYQLS